MTEEQRLPAAAAELARRSAEVEPLYVPLRRAIHISGLSKSTLYREAMADRLRLVKAGRSTLVDYASLRALLDGLPAAQLTNAA